MPARLFRALSAHAGVAGRVAVDDGLQRLTYAGLEARVARLAARLKDLGVAGVGLLLAPGAEWIVHDLACLRAGVPLVPLPRVFTDEQLEQIVRRSGLDLLITDAPLRLLAIFRGARPEPDWTLAALRLQGHPRLPPGACRVTFTSGSTGAPRGVCLSAPGLVDTAVALAAAARLGPGDRHLANLPFSVLLENVGGVWRTLLSGATCVVPAHGGALDAEPAVEALDELAATSTILVPEILKALVEAPAEQVARIASRLGFAGVGGAPVPPALIHAARYRGLAVHEGYGLSEAGSVVALNVPGADRVGSVGRPLSHVAVRIAPDGEIEVRARAWLGTLAEASDPGCPSRPTGDVGHLDDDGYLHVHGRRREEFITAWGRNVSPEWVERWLMESPEVQQCVVGGEGLERPVAVLVGRDREALERAVSHANSRLPEYARVGRWAMAATPFTVENGLLAPAGLPRRAAVLAEHPELRRRAAHASGGPS